MITVFTKSTMSTGNGQFVLYKKLKGSWKMCTDEGQTSKENALIYISERVIGEKIQMALRFQRDNHYYSPAVEKGELKMKKTSSEPASLGESYWFEKVDFGAVNITNCDL